MQIVAATTRFTQLDVFSLENMSKGNGVVIIGNGVAGISAARHLRKNDADKRIRVISDESEHFFSRTALMYVYMGHMQFNHLKPYEDWFWEKNRIELIFDRVLALNPEDRVLKMRSGETIGYDDLLIATGSRPKFYDWPGQDLEGVQGLVSLQDLEKLEALTPRPDERDKHSMKAVINGGGLIGVELAEMLLTRGVSVTMLVRDSWFWGSVLTEEEGRRISAHIQSHGVNLRHSAELGEILGDQNGRVRAVKTKEGEEIECSFCGITTGVTPNVEFLEGTGIEVNKGILVDEYLQTNIPHILAAGDCAQVRNPVKGHRGLEPVWYVGRMMGEVAGLRLAGKQTAYRPGPWYNSAKFFDIEYQVYGNMQTQPNEEQTHYFWEFEEGKKFLTIGYHPKTEVFQGISTFGIRVRHEFFDQVLREEKRVGEVISRIEKANFDTEFYKKWPKKLKKDFRWDTGIEFPETLLKKWWG